MKIKLFIPAVLWLVLTFILLTIPGPDLPKSDFFDLIYFDKWVHVGMFGLLIVLWAYPFLNAGRTDKKIFILISVCGFLYGVIMEFVQKFFAFERSLDFFDMLADGIGCLGAFLLIIIAIKKRYRGYKK
jgi:VanZ family protein